MKLSVSSILILFCLFVVVYGQQQRSNCFVDCATDIECETGCGPVWDDGDGCCRFCCETECVDCFQDPCNDYFCQDNSDWTCQPNYCEGCNREWYDTNNGYNICSKEVLITSDPIWDTECNTNKDCSLRNQENDFACCFAGACDVIDYSNSKWKPVNNQWWLGYNKACSIDCGPAPLCPAIAPIGTEWQAQCINQQCTKVNTEESSPFTTVSDTNSFTSVTSSISDDNSSFDSGDDDDGDDDDSNADEKSDSNCSNALVSVSSFPLAITMIGFYLFVN